MKYLLMIIACASSILMSACVPVSTHSTVMMAGQTFARYEVEFNARAGGGGSGVLATFSDNRNCKVPTGKSRKGCVAFDENSFGTITMSLRNEGGSSSTACGDSGVQWVITKVAATDTVDPSDDNKGKGSTFGTTALPAWAEKALFPVDDASKGILYQSEEADLSDATTSVVFLNRNNNTTPEVLWYQVTASKCGTDPVVTKVSDPRVENKGRN